MSFSDAPLNVSGDDVHLGFWTDYSHSGAQKYSLTLTTGHGNLFIAFIAIFVSLTGSYIWDIFRFASHQLLSRHTGQNVIYHQRQVALCNAGSPVSGFWKFWDLSLGWRKHKQSRIFTNFFPFLAASFILNAGFHVAGVFSSRIAMSNGVEVLLRGDSCGLIVVNTSNANPTSDYASQVAFQSRRIMSSYTYAQQCYDNNGSFQQACPTFPKPSLPYTITRNMSCPFPGQGDICRNNSGITLDSGFLNSQSDLGINTKPEQQFSFRTTMECIPIQHENYTALQSLNGTLNSTRTYVNFLYGYASQYGNASVIGNKTYQYPAEWPSADPTRYANIEYSLTVKTSFTGSDGKFINGFSSFKPISELQPAIGDVQLYFMSLNDISFASPVDDPWYSVHQKFDVVNVAGGPSQERYYRDDFMRVLGCVSKYQYCNPNAVPNATCTPLTGAVPAQEAAYGLFDTENQAYFNWTLQALSQAASPGGVVTNLGITSLLGRTAKFLSLQPALANNQWELEVENWFKVALADMQQNIVLQATGPGDPSVNRFVKKLNTTDQKKLCTTQKIRSNSYMNFSVLGLILTLAIGVLIMIVGTVLPTIAEHFNHNGYKSLEWKTNDVFQLQRLAYEGVGAGNWKRATHDCPTTDLNYPLPDLDINDLNHPRLRNDEVLEIADKPTLNQLRGGYISVPNPTLSGQYPRSSFSDD
ncbi:hypothetical protein BT63DRAFT_321076 [Microthyrium microscopicum]|uniref:Uncharacterized protein n=1 Tax=Microthyrium microscopicum TaxID=703497 RepID=A0A6A6U4N4_9PEZI|nr:hypothetical protein BT63DRAFT_321076 [Microthyrium microscopicum]